MKKTFEIEWDAIIRNAEIKVLETQLDDLKKQTQKILDRVGDRLNSLEARIDNITGSTESLFKTVDLQLQTIGKRVDNKDSNYERRIWNLEKLTQIYLIDEFKLQYSGVYTEWTEPEVKPCPFCGKKPAVTTDVNSNKSWYNCGTPHCIMMHPVTLGLWNKRAEIS